MRLIDADALPIVTRGKNHHRKYVFADITNAPTIDAIPVEWLEKQADYARSEWDYDTCEGIRIVLKAWQKEQETQK